MAATTNHTILTITYKTPPTAFNPPTTKHRALATYQEVVTKKRLKMYINVKNVCAGNQEAWSTIPAFANSFNSFSGNLSRIDEMNEQLQNTSKGTTRTKNQLKEQMVHDVMILAGALKAFASVKNDVGLARNVNVAHSELMRHKETDVDDVSTNILNKAKAVIKDLKDFGATKVEVDVATASINEFREMIGQPKSAIMKIKSLNEQTAAIFKSSDKLLEEQMDNLMVRFKSTNETFYKEYQSARRIGFNTSAKKEEAKTGSSETVTAMAPKKVSRKKKK